MKELSALSLHRHHASERALTPVPRANSSAVKPQSFQRSTRFTHAPRDARAISASSAETPTAHAPISQERSPAADRSLVQRRASAPLFHGKPVTEPALVMLTLTTSPFASSRSRHSQCKTARALGRRLHGDRKRRARGQLLREDEGTVLGKRDIAAEVVEKRSRARALRPAAALPAFSVRLLLDI